jgi:tetratricopeptide (TPR) repeat protein
MFHDQRGEYIRNATASAQSFTANKAYDEARGLLERAAAECPDSVDLQNAIQETAVAQAVQGGIAEVRAHVVEKKYDLALATLEGLLARYPEQAAIVRLYGEVRQQRNGYIQETIQHAQAFARDGDFERGLSLLRTALEIVPNAAEIQDNLEEMDRLRESIVRQRREAAEEARLVEAEIERAVAESRKQQHAGNLFDALRVLEETRRRFPKAAPRLEAAIQEIQESINLQMHLPEIALPAPVRRLPLWLIIAPAVLIVGVVVGVAVYLLRPAPPSGPAPAKPAVLAIDLRPWGEVDAVIQLDTDKEIDLPQKVTPLQLELAPGRYRVVYHFAGQPARSASEELRLEDSGYRVLTKVAPQLEQTIDRTVDELVGQ